MRLLHQAGKPGLVFIRAVARCPPDGGEPRCRQGPVEIGSGPVGEKARGVFDGEAAIFPGLALAGLEAQSEVAAGFEDTVALGEGAGKVGGFEVEHGGIGPDGVEGGGKGQAPMAQWPWARIRAAS